MILQPSDKKLQQIKKSAAIIIIAFILFTVAFIIGKIAPDAIDWRDTYFPATRAFLNGSTPYYPGSHLENPVWICILLAPFAIFPESLGRGLLLIASVFAYYAALRNAKLSRVWAFIVLLSPQILYGVNVGTIDAFVLIAPVLHPILGFILSITKPQIGFGFAIFLLVYWIREKKFREMLIALALSGIGLLISLRLGMPFSGRLISAPWNITLYPYSIIPGVLILLLAIIKHNKWSSIIASPMLSPYLTFHSWVVLFVVNNPYYLTAIFIISWVAYLVWHFVNI